MRIKELDTVVLNRNIEEHGLKKGDVGAVVHSYEGGTAFEVEFVTADGRTVAVIPLEIGDIRLMKEKEILHVRELASSLAV